ncbi:MAG TPA: glycosyltransferase family 4 protein [Candidatus Binatus sp.]|nr:glycosyltransferase family 4 protein [Candidatus Binatus sp.]
MARILWLTPFPPAPARNAGAGRMFELIRRLASRHEVDVLSFAGADDDPDAASALERAGPGHVWLVPRHADRRPDWLGLRPAEVAEYWDPAMTRALGATLANGAYDLLQVEYSPMAEYAPPRGAGPRAVWTVHELRCVRLRDELARRRGPVRALLAYRYLQMLRYELSLTARFDLIVAIAEAEAGELRARGAAAPVAVSPMGVDTRGLLPPAPSEAAERGLIVLVGFFGHAPNVDAARWFVGDILPRVRAARPDARVALVGREPPPAVSALAEPGIVEVTGFVPDLRPWLARAEVVVVPVREGGGVRGKVLEAWAAARPVVTTARGVAGLVAHDGENVLVADDGAAFAGHVSRLLADGELRRRLGAAGRRTAETRYDWDAIAAAHAELYDRLLAPRAA